MSAKCKSCGADITWVVTRSGKRMPVDALAENRFVQHGIEPDDTPRVRMMPTYVSHFVSCPNRDQHRKPRA